MNLHPMALHPRIYYVRSLAVVVGMLVLASASGVFADTHAWSASAIGNASVAGNWTPSGPPAGGDDVVFNAGSVNCTWDLDITVASWDQQATYTGTVTVMTVYSGAFDSLMVSGNMSINGGMLTHGQNSAAETYRLNLSIGGTLTVGASGSIDVTGKGFQEGNGPGAGGSYGGMGGQDNHAGGPTYGDIMKPTRLGSGGWRNDAYYGGGAIGIRVTGTATLNGAVASDGTAGYNAGGGGSGGSINLIASAISGTGSIHADGGYDGWHGNGGGGRIAVKLSGGASTFSGFSTQNIRAYGRQEEPWNPPRTSGSGTVYLQEGTQADGAGTIVIDNNGYGWGASGHLFTTIGPMTGAWIEDLSTADLIVRNAGLCSLTVDFMVDSLYIAAGTKFELGGRTLYTRALRVANADQAQGTYNDASFTEVTGAGSIIVTTFKVWDHGGGTASASTGANWSGDVAPVDGEKILLNGTSTANMTWDLPNTVKPALWLQGAGYIGTVTIDTRYTGGLDTMRITGDATVNGGRWSHGDNSNAETYRLCVKVGGNLTVGPGGSIDAQGLGYDKNTAPPAGFLDYQTCGSHGGRGGSGEADSIAGPTYGSAVAPTNLGSGAYFDGGDPSHGGGAIRLVVAGATTVNGSIKAPGRDVNIRTGAGGSVFITTGTISGSGTVSADGGMAVWQGGGTGGGGRVAVYVSSGGFGSLTNTPSACSGDDRESWSHRMGAAGTVYLDSTNNSVYDGRLIIDNNDHSPRTNTLTEVPASANWTVGSVTCRDQGRLKLLSGTSLTTNAIGTSLSTIGSSDSVINQGTLTITGTGPSISSGTLNSSAATATVTYTGQSDDAGVIIPAATYHKLIVNNAGTTFNLPSGNVVANDSVKIVAGTLVQNAGSLKAHGVVISSGATWRNASTGDDTLGAVGVVNNGTVDFDGNAGGCGSSDDIAIRSTVSGTQRPWSGSGTFSIQDVDVQDMAGSAALTALSSTNGGNNGANWNVLSLCAGVTVNDRGGFTNDNHPPLTLTSIFTGGGMRIAQYISAPTDTSAAAWKAFAATDSITLNTSTGKKYVWAQFNSAANGTGTRSSWYRDSTTYDNVAPTAIVTTSGTYTPATWPDTIRGTASEILSGLDSVQIQIKRTSDGYCWNGTAFVAGSQWVKATGTTAWTYYIDGPVMGDGIDSIYARPYDGAGNMGLAGGMITMDNRQPHATVVAIVDSSGYTPSVRVRVSITAIDADSIRAGVNDDTTSSGRAFVAFTSPGSIDMTLSSGDGVKYVSVQFKNANGNVSSWVTDSTILDQNLPSSVTIGNLTLQNYRAATWPDSISGTSADALSGIGAVRVRVKRGAGRYWNGATWVIDSTQGWVAAGGTSWRLTLPSDSLTDTSYNVTARAYDRAGNMVSTSRTFSYDNTAPAGTIVITDLGGFTNDSDPRLTLGTTSPADSMRVGLSPNPGLWRPYVAIDSVGISSGGQGIKRMRVQFKDVAGNVSDTAFDSTIYDIVKPTAQCTTAYIYNALYWPGKVAGTASDSLSGVQQVLVRIVNGSSLNWTGTAWTGNVTWLTATGTTGWSYPLDTANLDDGSYTVMDSVLDRAGNGFSSSASFSYSNTGPAGGSIRVVDTSGFTSDATPRCSLGVLNAVKMSMRLGVTGGSVNDTAAAAWRPFALAFDSIDVSRVGSGVQARVWVQFKDSIGNVSSWLHDATTYDALGPTTALLDTSAYSASTWPGEIRGTAFDATAGVSLVSIKLRNLSTGNAYNGSIWVADTAGIWLPVVGTDSWRYTIAASRLSDAAYQVTMLATDIVGNVQAPATVATFVYDNTGPTGGSIVVTDRLGFTNDADPYLRLQATGATHMRLHCGVDTTAWKSYATTDSVSVSALGDGLKRVGVQFRDSILNQSAWTYDSTTYDGTAPVSEISTSGTFNVATWPDTVRGTAFDAIAGLDSVWVSVRRDTAGTFWDGSGGWGSSAVWFPPAGLAAWRLPLSDGNLNNGGYTVLVRAVDKAGNRQAVADTGAFKFYTAPDARFAADPTSVLKGDSVSFYDSSTGVISSVQWSFGDGTTSTQRNPMHVYADTGEYSVTLRVTGPGGVDSLVRASYIRVFGDGQNPVKISGRYISDTLVALRYEYLDQVKGSNLNLPDELRLWRRVNQMPADSQKASDVLTWQIKLTAISHTGGIFVDTMVVPALSAPDSAYGFVTQITWLLSAPTPFAAYNAAYVLMRDTTRPGNELLLSGTYLGGDSVRINIDSAQTIDATVSDSVLVWYGLTNAPDFSSASTLRLSASEVVAGAAAGRYQSVIRQSAFDGVTQQLYVRLIQKGRSGLLSTDTTKAVFGVGRLRPDNKVALQARTLTSSEIELMWTAQPGGCDSIRIWYGTTAVPQNQVTFSTAGLTPLMYPSSVLKDTITGLAADTRFYFGLQIYRDRLWSVVIQLSSAEATTGAAGADVIPNTIDIDSIVFDTDSNYITIDWHVQLSQQFLTDYAVVYGVGQFDISIPTRWDPATDTMNRTILRLPEGVMFDTLYCIRMWAKSRYGQPSEPTNASVGTVRSPAYTWQVLANADFSQGDTARAFNLNVAVVNGGTATVPSSTVRVFDPADSLLAGFVPVSVGFAFDNPASAPPCIVALRYVLGSIPAGYSAQSVRIYRLTPEGVWLVQRSTVLDVNARIVSIRLDASTGDNLNNPFIAMVDTTAPHVTFSDGSDTASIVGFNGAPPVISDTMSIADNAGNVRWYLWYGQGAANAFSGTAQSWNELQAAVSTVTTNVPVAGAEDNGIRCILVVEDGVHSDTIDLSRRAWRSAYDDAVPEKMQWYPLHAALQLDSVDASVVLSSTAENPSTWTYDNRYARLFHFVSYEGNASAADDDKWVEYSLGPDTLFTFTPGALMWIKVLDAGKVGFGGGVTLSLKDTFEMRLAPRAWTDLALPFGFSMKLGDILAATGNGADTVLQFYSWEKPSDGQYVTLPMFINGLQGSDSTEMHPTMGGGYSVWNPSSQAVMLRFPATPAVASPFAKGRPAAAKAVADGGFLLKVDPSVDGIGQLSPVLCGYRPGAGAPTFYQNSPSFSAVRAGVWDGTGMRGHAVLHKSTDGGYAFGLVFTNPDDMRHRMSYTALPQTALPKGMSALLFNPTTGEYETPLPGGSYTAVVEGQSVAYRYLVVGDADYRIRFKAQFPMYKLALSTVYPNPMGRRLTIRFTVPYAGVRDVRFEMFDLKGRVLWQKRIDGMLRPGQHSLMWDCTSSRGTELAAGSYILRMTAREDGKRGVRSFKQRLTKIGR